MDTRNRNKTLLLAGVTALLLLAYSSSVSSAIVTSSYLYNLSNFTGTVRFSWVRSFIDPKSGEIYVTEGNTVRVFNQTGMEIFSFGDEVDLGVIYDIALDPEGRVLTLSYQGTDFFIVQCDFRGESIGKIRIANLPTDYSDFHPNRMICREGSIFLVDMSRMRVAVVDGNGIFQKGYDLVALMDISEKDRQDVNIMGLSIMGFSMDGEGNMLFTVPVLYRAYKVTPEGKVSSFGKRGSAPGRFGVVAGIAADGKGNYLVADTLRSVVMIFDKNFQFQGEFGYRGFKPGNLIGPREVTVDTNNRVYVTQLRGRGISVYSLLGN